MPAALDIKSRIVVYFPETVGRGLRAFPKGHIGESRNLIVKCRFISGSSVPVI